MIISRELDILNRLVLTDLKSIAHYRTHGSMINHQMRELIYGVTGFPLLEPLDANAEKAKAILQGPTYRVLWRLTSNHNYRTEWLPKSEAIERFDEPFAADIQFGGLVLESGEFRAVTVFEMADILKQAETVNS